MINPLPNSLDELCKIARELGIPCEMMPPHEIKRLIVAEQDRRKEAKWHRIYALLSILIPLTVTFITIYLGQN